MEMGVKELAPLRHLKTIEELKLDGLEQLDTESFRHLKLLNGLRILSVRFCGLDDAILKCTAQCPRLQELCIE